MSLSVPALLVAGFLTFLSPCVLPLIPVYLAMLAGTTAVSLREGRQPGQVGAGRGGILRRAFVRLRVARIGGLDDGTGIVRPPDAAHAARGAGGVPRGPQADGRSPDPPARSRKAALAGIRTTQQRPAMALPLRCCLRAWVEPMRRAHAGVRVGIRCIRRQRQQGGPVPRRLLARAGLAAGRRSRGCAGRLATRRPSQAAFPGLRDREWCTAVCRRIAVHHRPCWSLHGSSRCRGRPCPCGRRAVATCHDLRRRDERPRRSDAKRGRAPRPTRPQP